MLLFKYRPCQEIGGDPMNRQETHCQKMLQVAPFGYACHQMIFDEDQKPVDYVFLEVNRAFEKITGLHQRDIVGKRVTDILPDLARGSFDWIDRYGTLVKSSKEDSFEAFSEPLHNWYKVKAIPLDNNHFVTFFTMVDEEMRQFYEYRSFMTSLKDLVFEVRADYTITKVVALDTDGLFLQKEDFLLKRVDEVLSGELTEKLMPLFHQVHKTGRRRILEYPSPYPDDQRWFEAQVLLKRKDPEDVSFVVVVRDITHHRQLQEQINQTVEELNRFFSISMDLLCIATVKGQFVRVNQAWKDVLGYTDDELKNQYLMDFVHPDDQKITREKLVCLESGQEVRNFVNRYRSCDGTYQYLEWRSRSHGSFIYAAARDVTEKQLQEAALKKSEDRYRGMLNSQTVLIVRVAPDNNLTYVNDAYCRKFGRSQESLIGSSFIPLVHPEDQQSTMKALQGLAVPPHRVLVEQRAMTVDGWRWLAWEDWAIVDDEGNILEIQGVARDITLIKENEDRLVRSLAEKDIMLKEIHHRVKNNLQIISSLLYLQGVNSENSDVTKVLRNSQGRVEAMALLHEKIYHTPDLASINLLDYLGDLAHHVHDYYTQAIDPVSLIVRGETLFLSIEKAIVCGLILNELLTNALEHAFRGVSAGTVTLTLELVSPGTAQLVVADDGIGFPEDFHLDNTNSLGIQLIRNLSHQMDGTFDLIRSPQTQCSVRFPI